MSFETVKSIVKAYLEKEGYDGLVHGNRYCACLVDDLFPCEDETDQCEAGHKAPCDPEDCQIDGECDWHINAGKREVNVKPKDD